MKFQEFSEFISGYLILKSGSTGKNACEMQSRTSAESCSVWRSLHKF